MTPLPAVVTDETDVAACSEELSDADAERPLRVHVHCFLKFRVRQRIRDGSVFELMGSKAMKSSLSSCLSGRVRQLGCVGLYYMQCPKIGMLRWGGTVSPFKDYHVHAD